MAAYTPMIQQYLTVKADYQDAFLFFRLGDFYEMFFEDAIKASQELEITLTSREGGAEERFRCAEFRTMPLPTILNNLFQRAIKLPFVSKWKTRKQTKGMVKREVVQLITPGTVMDGKGLADKENNYIASITAFEDQTYGFAYNDISTGESRVTLFSNNFDEVLNELAVLSAKEVVVASNFDGELQKKMRERDSLTISFEDNSSIEMNFSHLLEDLNQDKLKQTTARLFNYLYRSQKRSLDHLQPVTTYQIHQYMKIDYYSKRNLELTETIRSKGKKGSLLWLLDETMTAMGGRMLKTWIDRPLIDHEKIEHRHDLVEVFINHYFERQELRKN